MLTSLTELTLKLLKLNHTAEIYAKRHLTDKLSNYDLILDRYKINELGMICNFENKPITWQEVSILKKPPNCKEKRIHCNQSYDYCSLKAYAFNYINLHEQYNAVTCALSFSCCCCYNLVFFYVR